MTSGRHERSAFKPSGCDGPISRAGTLDGNTIAPRSVVAVLALTEGDGVTSRERGQHCLQVGLYPADAIA